MLIAANLDFSFMDESAAQYLVDTQCKLLPLGKQQFKVCILYKDSCNITEISKTQKNCFSFLSVVSRMKP